MTKEEQEAEELFTFVTALVGAVSAPFPQIDLKELAKVQPIDKRVAEVYFYEIDKSYKDILRAIKEKKMAESKISIGQIMAEVFCYDALAQDDLSNAWNALPKELREQISENLKNYLGSCVGMDKVVE